MKNILPGILCFIAGIAIASIYFTVIAETSQGPHSLGTLETNEPAASEQEQPRDSTRHTRDSNKRQATPQPRNEQPITPAQSAPGTSDLSLDELLQLASKRLQSQVKQREPGNISFTGRVMLADGTPLPGVTIETYYMEDSRYRSSVPLTDETAEARLLKRLKREAEQEIINNHLNRTTRSGEDGSYHLEVLVELPDRISAKKDGYAISSINGIENGEWRNLRRLDFVAIPTRQVQFEFRNSDGSAFPEGSKFYVDARLQGALTITQAAARTEFVRDELFRNGDGGNSSQSSFTLGLLPLKAMLSGVVTVGNIQSRVEEPISLDLTKCAPSEPIIFVVEPLCGINLVVSMPEGHSLMSNREALEMFVYPIGTSIPFGSARNEDATALDWTGFSEDYRIPGDPNARKASLKIPSPGRYKIVIRSERDNFVLYQQEIDAGQGFTEHRISLDFTNARLWRFNLQASDGTPVSEFGRASLIAKSADGEAPRSVNVISRSSDGVFWCTSSADVVVGESEYPALAFSSSAGGEFAQRHELARPWDQVHTITLQKQIGCVLQIDGVDMLGQEGDLEITLASIDAQGSLRESIDLDEIAAGSTSYDCGIFGLIPGEYQVRIEHDKDDDIILLETTIQLSSDGQRISIALPRTYTLTITLPTGVERLSNFEVLPLFTTRSRIRPDKQDDGTYVIKGVPAGKYLLRTRLDEGMGVMVVDLFTDQTLQADLKLANAVYFFAGPRSSIPADSVIQSGDYLIGFGETRFETGRGFEKAIYDLSEAEDLTLIVLRNGQEIHQQFSGDLIREWMQEYEGMVYPVHVE